MDYCHPCRRHLNGALVCPGCGAPAEQLHAYPSEEEPRTAAYETYDEAEYAPEGEEAAPEAGTGTSRRDRKAAAHRRRRRRTLLITAGFLLAAGGLSLAELGLDAPGSPPAPAAAGDSSTDGGAGAETGESAEPISDTPETSPSASPSTSASPSPSKSEKDKESKKPEEKPTKAPQSWSTDAGAPQTPAPGPTTEDPVPDPTPDPPTPEPEPEPTETCTRFLWWCS